ncbi:MAG: S-layer protein [Candidatus Nanosalina sp.]
MKTIKKIKESSKAVAGTALLVGATLAGGAAFATASSHMSGSSGSGSLSLGDYPQPFIGEDGTVQSTIVMGADAKATDVVAAANIAGQLGNDAFTTEQVSAGTGGAAGSWSATNGVTLDTQNDNLYFGDSLTTVRDTLTSQQLQSLSDTEFQDDNGDTTTIENYLYPGSQAVQFGKPDDRNNQDPVQYVQNPANPSAGDYLYKLQANFEDQIDFAANDVEDQEIQLFGQTYTVSTDTNSNELVLLGSQDTTTVNSGSSTTITINGQEHTFEVVGVTSSNPPTAAVRIDGELYQKDEDETVTVDGTEVRLSDIIQTNSQTSAGVVTFAVGNDELVLKDGQQIEDGDGNDIDGTKVNFQGLDNSDAGDGSDDSGQTDDSEEFAASGIEIMVGAQNDDHEYVMAGESYSHDLFPSYTFRFGGMNPDATSGDSESVGQIEYGVTGGDTGTVSLTTGGSSATLEFAYDQGADNSEDNEDGMLADSDGDKFVVREGAAVDVDEYVSADAGDFAHMWEVTSIDRDSTSSLVSGDEATITLQDAVTGSQVEVDLDATSGSATDGLGSGDSSDDYYAGTEVIDGQTYTFVLEGEDADAVDSETENSGSDVADFRMAYGSGTSEPDTTGLSDTTTADALTLDTGDETTLYAPVDTQSNAALALTKEVTLDSTIDQSDIESGNEYTLVLPSTESTDAKTLTVDLYGTNDNTDSSADGDISLNVDSATAGNFSPQPASGEASPSGQSTVYFADAQSGGPLTFGLADDTSSAAGLQQDTANTNGVFAEPAAVTVLPEDDNDQELAYITQFDDRTGSDGVEVTSPTYTGETDGMPNNAAVPGFRQTATLESDDDITAGVDIYGTYTEYDQNEEGSVTLNVPSGQSTVGAAFTTQGGSISATGGGSGSVQTMTPTGWPANSVALDTDSNIGTLKQNRNLVLVGGPAANNLVQELVSANKTMPASDYTSGQAMIQLVENAFNQDHAALVVAGHSGEDTRAAGRFLTNYEQHQQALSGQDQVTINTAEGTVVQ